MSPRFPREQTRLPVGDAFCQRWSTRGPRLGAAGLTRCGIPGRWPSDWPAGRQDPFRPTSSTGADKNGPSVARHQRRSTQTRHRYHPVRLPPPPPRWPSNPPATRAYVIQLQRQQPSRLIDTATNTVHATIPCSANSPSGGRQHPGPAPAATSPNHAASTRLGDRHQPPTTSPRHHRTCPAPHPNGWPSNPGRHRARLTSQPQPTDRTVLR